MPWIGWSWFWIAWLFAGVVWETLALIIDWRGTLSNQVWTWFGVKAGIPIWQWSALHIFLAAFLAWAFLHLVFGIWR